MNNSQVDTYLERIGATRPTHLNAAELGRLQGAHLRAVPFENLSIHLGEPIVLTEDALYDKVVRRRRGGFCYEVNGLFGALLSALGYQVELLSARVYGDGRFGPPHDHLALRVEADGPRLVDVGFGTFATQPLGFDVRGPQSEGYQIELDGDQFLVRSSEQPEYLLDPRPYQLSDFGPTCWWQQTSPDSHFTQSLTCSRLTEGGRITLSGARLITKVNGERSEEMLGSDEEIRNAYREHFGIEFDRLPTIPDVKD